jgi:hypothetical protein
MNRAFALCLVLAFACGASAADTWRYAAPGRVVAVGDVHGAYATLVDTLEAAGLIDESQHWRGGNAHLVSVGDLLDRGADSRKVLDLLMRLEGEASAAGGRVHVLLGNHEVMNLGGELRDAAPGEFAAFSSDETAAQRAQEFESWRSRQPPDGDEAAQLASFDAKFPPGWFAHRRAFAADGKYGAWLLQRPVAIVVGDTAFVHGGLSSALAGYDLVRLNREFQAQLAAYLGDVAALERGGWIGFEVPGETRPVAVTARLAAAGEAPDPVLVATAQRVVAFDTAPLFSVQGPVWYRGLAMCRPVLMQDVANSATRQFEVTRIAMGHTVTPSLRPTTRLRGRAVLLDTGMLRSVYRGHGHATEFGAGGLSTIRDDGTRSTPVEDNSIVGMVLPGGSDAALEALLRDSPVTSNVAVEGEDRHAVQLTHAGGTLLAWWYPDHKAGGRHAREVAAYRLDRVLGLGLVPTTVARTIDGAAGALQWRPDELISMAQAAAGATGGTPWCDTTAQIELLYVWDALIGNGGRTEASLAWTTQDWTLLASDHRFAFTAATGAPAHLEGRALRIGPELCRRLGALDAGKLRAALEGAANARERNAVLRRRDGMVKDAGCGG